MKKIFTSFIILAMAMSMHASLHISIEQWIGDDEVIIDITKDTTIVVTEYEYDEDLEEATMGVHGVLYSDESQAISVTITRAKTGIVDQFCAGGNCVPGNGELTQVCDFTIGSLASMRQFFTHYTPTEAGKETIVYAINDGNNPTITLTIVYSYLSSAVENVVMPQGNNIIYNLLGQRMPSNELSELPAGIYILNGKKYIKK
jgi:hypothetical protein